MYAGKLKTNSNIAWHRPQSTTFREEEELMQKSSRALESATDPLERLRLLCLCRGAAGVMGLTRVFRRMDDDSSKQITKDEFFDGIKETGLGMGLEEAEELFNRFDTENTGSISLNEFIREIRPPMSDSRRAIVEQAFRKLDRTGDGHVTIDDIKKMYSVDSNSRYKSGEETAEVILKVFLENFEKETVDNKVTLEDFMNYYCAISMAIESDCYFDLMMRQSYNL